jgi:uncharacterized protein (DUF1499 family)
MNRFCPLHPSAMVLAAAVLLVGCAGTPPGTLGPQSRGLAPCPGTPNCVHTGDGSPAGTAPWNLEPAWASRAAGTEAEATRVMDALEEGVLGLPRTRVIRRSAEPDGSHYLHAEVTSRIFRFVDDLELLLRPGEGTVVVRSASRLGHGDLGVNRARVEALRKSMENRGLLAAPEDGPQ